MCVSEDRLIARLRGFATDPAARALTDDAAVLAAASDDLVLTHDMLVEGVHFLPDDAAEGVAWKLVAVNMSDLAAKGATPLGVILGYGMARDAAWDAAFASGLEAALCHFGAPLLGGDTVRMPDRGGERGPVTLGMTAIGRAPAGGAPPRGGARAGDDLWLSGPVGDAGLGLMMRQGRLGGGLGSLAHAYTHPQPNMALGQDLAGQVSAMMDVSDGLLIDAARMAAASGAAIMLALDAVPLSDAWRMVRGETAADRIDAATMGDDYVLLFAAAPDKADAILAAGLRRGAAPVRIGQCGAGAGLTLTYDGAPVPLPERLGYLHD
jgi:thiamine-monophosphate kinase